VKSLTVAVAFLCVTTTTSAASEMWTCSYVGGNEAGLMRFEVSPPAPRGALIDPRCREVVPNRSGLLSAASCFLSAGAREQAAVSW
jgi:hypothetical protein